MEVKTKALGTVSVNDDRIITLPEGLFGFEDYKKYALIDSEYKPLLLMQSIDEQNLSFYIIDPFLFCNDYEVDVEDKILKKIDLSDPSDVCVMSIVTLPAKGNQVTANLQGPLIINRKNNKCLQVVLGDEKYTTKFDIISALKAGDASC